MVSTAKKLLFVNSQTEQRASRTTLPAQADTVITDSQRFEKDVDTFSSPAQKHSKNIRFYQQIVVLAGK